MSKLAAGREKDRAFVEAMVRAKLALGEVIRQRISITPGLPPDRQLALSSLVSNWDQRGSAAGP